VKKVWMLRKLEGTLAFIWNRATIPRLSILWLSQIFHEYKQRAWRKVSVRIKVTLLFVEMFMRFTNKERRI
jgi:hypothetical protein